MTDTASRTLFYGKSCRPTVQNRRIRSELHPRLKCNHSMISEEEVVLARSCVFFRPSCVYIGSMNATACYFVSVMAAENTEIARGLRRRDPDLLDHLIEKYQHRLLRYLLYLTGRRELAEDFFQETWIRVLERGHQFNDKYAFSTWLFAVARNLAIDHMRRKQPASLDGLMNNNDAPFDVPATGLA